VAPELISGQNGGERSSIRLNKNLSRRSLGFRSTACLWSICVAMMGLFASFDGSYHILVASKESRDLKAHGMSRTRLLPASLSGPRQCARPVESTSPPPGIHKPCSTLLSRTIRIVGANWRPGRHNQLTRCQPAAGPVAMMTGNEVSRTLSQYLNQLLRPNQSSVLLSRQSMWSTREQRLPRTMCHFSMTTPCIESLRGCTLKLRRKMSQPDSPHSAFPSTIPSGMGTLRPPTLPVCE
jgi:hypothetical protein